MGRATGFVAGSKFAAARITHGAGWRFAPMILINDSPIDATDGERLIDVISRSGVKIPQLCYHPQLGAIQTCDTCMVEIGGELVRACGAAVSQNMSVRTATQRAKSARKEAFDRILSNHLLYCTVCDNNNGDCLVHNTTKMLAVEHQTLS